MNTNALYELVSLINKDYQKNQIPQLLGQMAESMNHMISNPGHPQFQVAFATAKTQIYKVLSASAVNGISPKQKLMAVEMEIEELLGEQFKEIITKLIDENQMTPAAMQKPLQAFHARITKFMSSTTSLITAFDDLIPTETEDGECEMGVLIPNTFTNKDLSLVVKEMEDFEGLYLNIEEICENKRTTPKLSSLSTSDPLIVIVASVPICACFAKAVEWVLNSYKTLLEIRKLRSELLEKGISEKAVQAIDEEANKRIEDTVGEVVEKVLKEFYNGKDGGRERELKVELKHNLLKLAYKIDNGFAYEVKVRRSPETPSSELDMQQMQMIENASKSIEFTNLEGNPVLRLPPPIKDDHHDKASGKKPK